MIILTTTTRGGVSRTSISALMLLASILAGSAFSLDPKSRETSRVFFNTVYMSSEGIAMNWTGSYQTGDPGTTDAAFREATIRRVNYFRAMAGIPAEIVLDAAYSRKAQQAALMMSENKSLSHNPPLTWKFYTAEGAEAAENSNLSYGRSGPDAVVGQMADDRSNNQAVGHRRWLLLPQTRSMGAGDVPGLPDRSRDPANAVWVFDDNTFGVRPLVRDEFVAWPPAGFVPYQVLFSRWSFGLPNASFANATVTMTRHGTNVAVRLEPISTGLGENTLVWVPDNADTTGATVFSRPAKDTTNRVVISGVIVGGQTRSFQYDVVVFDPQKPGLDTQLAVVSGPATVDTISATAFSAARLQVASGSQWRIGKRNPNIPIEGAEAGLSNPSVLLQTSGTYEPIELGIAASGQASYHLACPDFSNQYLFLQRTLLAKAGSQLRFRSRLAFATETQIAVVQASFDEGGSWQTLFRQPGTLSFGESSFVQRQVDLAEFKDRTVQIRFGYLYEGGQAVIDTDPGTGWHLDDITFVGTDELTLMEQGVADSAGSFSVKAATPGEYAVQARGVVFGNYATEWGPALAVSASANPILRPRLLGLEPAGGGLEVVAEVQPGRSYRIEFSENLSSWNPLGTFTPATTTLRAADPSGFSPARRFYRMVIP